MRMWNVDVTKMCNKHLLGEHCEMHMFVGSIKKKISITGYIVKGLVEVRNINKRHDEIVEEMLKRGMNHNTPIDCPPISDMGTVNVGRNIKELRDRCKECKF